MSNSITLTSKTADDPMAAGVLKVLFAKTKDRWSHQILLMVDSSEYLIATSCEGNPDEDWPASPVFQELHEEQLGEMTVVLGVGMAGVSHWSTSVSPSATQNQNEENGSVESLLFDMACLVKADPSAAGWLGSSYQLSDHVTVCDESAGETNGSTCLQLRMKQPISGHDFVIQLRGKDVHDCEFSGALWRCQGNEISVIPARKSESPVKATRWAYYVECSSKPIN